MSNNENIETKLNNEINIHSSINVENNPIVIQLQEFGYNNIYARRVFYYLHPENLDEALNYMSVERGIIQHRFIQERNTSNKICYICGEAQEKHLNELNINNNNNINEINQSGIRNNSIGSNNQTINTINVIFDNININENKNEINKEEKDEISEGFNDINFKMFSFKYGLNSNKNNIFNKQLNNNNTTIEAKESNEGKIECIICNELFIVNEKNKNEKCGHAYCSSCWYDFLSVNIKENKLPSIKCLDYNCKEKLLDKFIINLLNSDIDLINKYKRYKFELEIINDPNKKLCPYPNCDSFLELKEIRQRDVACENKHEFCFICLKPPHGNLPCDEDIDKSIVEYAKNNFVKKCPKCGIVIEKKNGCNHITCTKCKYQWCWLCNEEYEPSHYNTGKCKGFQFFRPKNDYEIKLMIEGKINSRELNDSQRQFDHLEQEREHIHNGLRRLRRRMHRNRIIHDIHDIHDHFMFTRRHKIRKILYYIFFGNPFSSLNGDNMFQQLIICFMYYITYFFWLIFFNIISFLLIIRYAGFENFMRTRTYNYYNKFRTIFVHALLFWFISSFLKWNKLINDSHIHFKLLMKIIVFFPCFILSIIILFPQIIVFNIFCLIILYCRERYFPNFLQRLNDML